MNEIFLTGRLTADPEVKTGNTNVAKYTLAVRFSKEVTDFFNCVTFASQAEIASKYLKKGDLVSVRGNLSIDKYTDKEGGKHERPVINVERHYLLPNKRD